MTYAKSKCCNKTNSSRVITVINRVLRWSYELKNFGFKNRKAQIFLNEDLSRCPIQLWSMENKSF